MSIVDVSTATGAWDDPRTELRVRRVRTDDLRAARQLAERAGYRGNSSDVARFALALAAEIVRCGSEQSLEVALQRVMERSRSVLGRRRCDFT